MHSAEEERARATALLPVSSEKAAVVYRKRESNFFLMSSFDEVEER
ncbi:MAG: hypothetical protein ACRD1N_07270 [Terriglobia bacterium]